MAFHVTVLMNLVIPDYLFLKGIMCCIAENVYIYKLFTLKSCRYLKMTC